MEIPENPTTVGNKMLMWGTIGTELIVVVYDLRYMVICSIALILADLWWGYSESQMRKEMAKDIGNMTLVEKFKWRRSRAIRRTANKTIDYLTYLVVGALIGLAITEPMGICTHIWSAAIGLGIGCACEMASIISHVAFVKLGVEVSLVDCWKAFVRFLGRLIKAKSAEIGDAVEGLSKFDESKNMED